MTHNLLKGKRGIIFGALNEDSIAWKVALKAAEEGAQITLSNTAMALRSGAGLVYLASVEPVIQLVLSRTPECCACGCRTAANGGIHPQDAFVPAVDARGIRCLEA